MVSSFPCKSQIKLIQLLPTTAPISRLSPANLSDSHVGARERHSPESITTGQLLPVMY